MGDFAGHDRRSQDLALHKGDITLQVLERVGDLRVLKRDEGRAVSLTGREATQ